MQQAPALALLQQNRKKIEMSMPKFLNPERFLRIAASEFSKNPAMHRCDPMTFLAAVTDACQLGLELSSVLGHAYLVPYGNRCQLIVGYRGMIELARRSGYIKSLQARIVGPRDKFEYSFGLNSDELIHVPATTSEGDMTHVYAIARLTDGGTQFEVMTKQEVEDIRAQSKSGNSGPWQKNFNEMAKKTVIRRLFKMLPISVELEKAFELDDEVVGIAPERPDPVKYKALMEAEVIPEPSHERPIIDRLMDIVKEKGMDPWKVIGMSREELDAQPEGSPRLNEAMVRLEQASVAKAQ
jgi:recombination protein RecT